MIHFEEPSRGASSSRETYSYSIYTQCSSDGGPNHSLKKYALHRKKVDVLLVSSKKTIFGAIRFLIFVLVINFLVSKFKSMVSVQNFLAIMGNH